MLAVADFTEPVFLALLIGWIMSVVLHEWAHGLVAYLGGDYTIKERGGLSLNPLQYVDPMMSLALPALFLLMGGVPLPGGVTYIRHDLLRSRGWESAVSLAGPAMNFLLFLLLALPFHPRLNWIDTSATVEQFQTWHIFIGAMALLQITAVFINLIPVPPLDGFGIFAPYMDNETRIKLTTPPIGTFAFIVLFLILWQTPGVWQVMYNMADRVLEVFGFDHAAMQMMWQCYNVALFGRNW